MKVLYIIKIGGELIDDETALSKFLKDFAGVEEAKILVHGGGKIASLIGEKLGVLPQMIDGRRITDAETLKVVTMVYGGLVNKHLVAQLQAFDCNAIGLSGADGNLLTADKRPVKDIDYGFAGDVEPKKVNLHLINTLIDEGMVPVISALTHDGHGHMLNTNADTMASVIAQALADSYVVKLIYCFDKPGVLKDSATETIFPVLTIENTDGYISKGVISAGMLPKLKNAFDAANNNSVEVRLGYHQMLNGLIEGKEGTMIK